MMLGIVGGATTLNWVCGCPQTGSPSSFSTKFWSDALQVPEPGVDPLPHRLVEVKLRRPAQAGRRRLERV